MRNAIVFLLLLSASVTYAQKNIRLRSALAYETTLSSIWGYADTSGNEYALVGARNGLSIVDVTNPDSINELFLIPGPLSNWREIKTWNHHAYASNEAGDGLLIVDLSFLPDTVHYLYWNADSALARAHTLFIDENGILYLFGYNNMALDIPFDERGALMCDLKPSPEAPVVLGSYNRDYVHDGFVRGDTLWASQISRGNLAVVDVSDKMMPTIYTTQETPNRFTHNSWLSDDGDFLFTTDERAGAFITAYDVSDVGNIFEVDRWQARPGSQLVPHNTHFLDNYLVTSYYRYGVNIIDATNPSHLVEIGYYDTSPLMDSAGFRGCWGVYPYLPSGTILASDIETGLYVLTPQYKRACYLRGTVTDLNRSIPLHDVTVEIMATNSLDFTVVDGSYKTGISDSGSYDIRFYRPGCMPKIITGVDLRPGIVTTLNIELSCTSYVSIPEVMQDEIIFAAYPTLFNESTTIQYHLPVAQIHEPTYLQLFEASGRMLHTSRLRDAEGEVVLGNDLSSGMYLLKLTNGKSSKTLKVIKTN